MPPYTAPTHDTDLLRLEPVIDEVRFRRMGIYRSGVLIYTRLIQEYMVLLRKTLVSPSRR